jgi:adenosylcobinamide-GDP ribazoletransferase
VQSFLSALPAALRFWSRLPVPFLAFEEDPHGAPAMSRLAPAAPVAGALIGLLGALVLAIAVWFGLPDAIAAILATGALLLATGAMHEDALGDVADGFGGGRTPEEKLRIMKDPRLGTYGVCALVSALLLRVGLLAGLATALGAGGTALAMAGAAALGRTAGLWPLASLAPARADGIGAVAAGLDSGSYRTSALVAAAIGGLGALAAVGLGGAIAALAVAAIAAAGMAALARRQIGGQTGDVCGAATLVAELAVLTALLAAASP